MTPAQPLRLFFARHWFTLALPLAFAVAWFYPGIASRGGLLKPEITTRWGVSLIFFLQGLTLPTGKLGAGFLHLRFHILVQGFIFLGFPLLGLLLDAILGTHLIPEVKTGLLFLCILPSTISSSAVLTATAGGNVAGAVSAAILASLLGVVVTPLWASHLFSGIEGDIAFLPVVFSLVRLMILPLLIGQILRLTALRHLAARRKRGISHISSTVILFIVFAAFSDAVVERVWATHGAGVLWLAVFGAVLLFVGANAILLLLARAVRLEEGDRIAALFCGVQKSLASGVTMAAVVFGEHPGLGLILLPLLVYHPLELTVHGIYAAHRSAQIPV